MTRLNLTALMLIVFFGAVSVGNTQTVVAGWDFEDQDPVADSGTDGSGNSPDNTNQEITGNDGGTITYPGGNAPSAGESFSTNNWEMGEFVTVSVNTVNYNNLSLELDTRSSSSGPGDFTIFYGTEGVLGNFVEIPDGEFQSPTSFSENPMFTFILPEECSSEAELLLKIACTSNVNAGGEEGIGSTGTFRIDNLRIMSTLDNPLPVDLLGFKAIPGDGEVTLVWTTASEINNRGFFVLRSKKKYGIYDIIDSYTMNTSLRGRGSASEKTIYRYTDRRLQNGMEYWYKIADVDMNGKETMHGPVFAVPVRPEAEADAVNVPVDFKIWPAYPNPFNPETLLRLDVPDTGKDALFMDIRIYSAAGQQVRSLFNGNLIPGTHSFSWNGRDDRGRLLPGGTYFFNVRSDQFQKTGKMTLVK